MTESYSDEFIRDILTRTKRVAVVGVSMDPTRPSHYVAQYLVSKGYEVFPVNPGHAGKEVFGQTMYGRLDEIEGGVDMVDIFRRSEDIGPVVEDALAAFPDLQTIWMQMGIKNEAAAEMARARGVDVVMDRCPKVEYPRLFGNGAAAKV